MPDPALTPRVLVRVLGHWLPSHCSDAKFRLAALLSIRRQQEQAVQVGLRVRVETAAGIIVGRFSVGKTATVLDVKMKLANMKMGAGQKVPPASAQHLLVSGCERHGELQNASQLEAAVQNILIAAQKCHAIQPHACTSGRQKGTVSTTSSAKATSVGARFASPALEAGMGSKLEQQQQQFHPVAHHTI